MKKTTYILLGALALMFIFLIISPLFLRMVSLGDGVSNNDLLIDTLDINKKSYNDIRAIRFENIGDSKRFIACNANITPGDSDITTISLPKSNYFSTSKNGDTLVVTLFKITDTEERPAINIYIKAPQNLSFIRADYGFNANINGMQGDSLSIYTAHGAVTFNKSAYRAIDYKGWSGRFKAKETTIDSLYIDTDDGNNNWTIEKCNINTEFITGSDYNNYFFGENECKRIVWIPKGDNAKFALGGKGKFIIIPCKEDKIN